MDWYNKYKLSSTAFTVSSDSRNLIQSIINSIRRQWTDGNFKVNFNLRFIQLFGNYKPMKNSWFSKSKININENFRINVIFNLIPSDVENTNITAEIQNSYNVHFDVVIVIKAYVNKKEINLVNINNRDIMFNRLLINVQNNIETSLLHEFSHLTLKWLGIDKTKPEEYIKPTQSILQYNAQPSERESFYRTIQDGLYFCAQQNYQPNGICTFINQMFYGIKKFYPKDSRNFIERISGIVNGIDSRLGDEYKEYWNEKIRPMVVDVLKGKHQYLLNNVK